MTATASAVIVAGGASRRFGAGIPKQFSPVVGKPLLAHTVARFAGCAAIDRAVIVLPRDAFDEASVLMAAHLDPDFAELTPGGATRQESVWAGLVALRLEDDSLVAVHDGARPLADEALIERVVEAAAGAGGAIAAMPVVETLKEVSEEGEILGTVDRRRLHRAQTPQCFFFRVLRSAFERAERDGYLGTDEAELVERDGATIRVVAGSEHNIKVTTPEDLSRVEYFLSQRPA